MGSFRALAATLILLLPAVAIAPTAIASCLIVPVIKQRICTDGPGSPLAPVSAATQAGPHTVIAVVDTGINPYHEFFRAPALVDHPSTWLSGFPANATQVNLSLNAPDLASALAADSSTWTSLQRSTLADPHLYTFPGTRVVGGISFGEYTGLGAVADSRPVYDAHGHGTHSAGLAAGANTGGADGNVLLVMVEAGNADSAIRWAARQPWIDAISVSLGALANLPAPGIEHATREAFTHGKPIFIASGNGFSDTGLPPDHCTTYTSAWVGPSWVTRVGAAEPQSGDPTWWHCLPVEAIARTNVGSPDIYSMTTNSSAGGTSAATPNLAGHFALLLQRARENGSAASPTTALDHLLHAAQPAPNQPGVGRDPSLAETAFLDQGYGLVDAAAVDRAQTTLLGSGGPTPRPEMDAWLETDHAIRDALWGPGSPTWSTVIVHG